MSLDHALDPAAALPDSGLPDAIRRTSQSALAAGALQPIATKERRVEDRGVRFLVRMVSSLAAKEASGAAPAAASGPPTDPFLPYEPALKVADLGPGHVCLLNKFNVIDGHLLIVTRAYEDQEALLTHADLAALWRCLGAIDGLGFYNGGPVAGASQPHKHLQLVPRALCTSEPDLPIEALIGRHRHRHQLQATTIPGLPFRHAFAWLDPRLAADSAAAADASLDCYRALLARVGLPPLADGPSLRQSGPYNLLLTREWMLLVPRSAERCEGISVNALGFAGSLFVRDAAALGLVQCLGPFTLLSRVGFPA